MSAMEVERTVLERGLAALLPDDEQRGAGPVLPAQDVGRAERAEVEVGVAGVVDTARSGPSYERRAAVHQLLEVRVVAGRDERLRVELDRERAARSCSSAAPSGRRSSDRAPEHVVPVVGLFDPLRFVVIPVEAEAAADLQERGRAIRHSRAEIEVASCRGRPIATNDDDTRPTRRGARRSRDSAQMLALAVA